MCRNFSPSLFLLATCVCLFGILFYVNPYLSHKWTLPLAFSLWWFSVLIFVTLLVVSIAK